ncbi:rap guanine nucleotide exchange factor 5-like [Sinocyclocheilus rhinocerous]|uniref:rap guanine nucleotide exchange factor 5-like n=1 Tax=Sinocyclocheilus rhinocerous TaxID=307959 RepID=UPI0007BACCD7|nr:PREDICTED: rap guanine nucleotide exchange factor 5-like [Sinocyclocheilus rhinocerous]
MLKVLLSGSETSEPLIKTRQMEESFRKKRFDQRLVFEDSNTYYQFSFEECDAQGCEFRSEEEWQSGVRLLLQLVPYVQFRVVSPPEEDPDRKRDICSEILQMKALERLTSTVQNELAAALARKAKKSMSEDESSEASDASPQEPQKPTEDRSKQAGVCALRAPDDFSRMEMVQRLAKDGYRFLQNQNYRLPDRSAQAQGEGVVRVCLKERGQDVLVLQRVPSDPASPQTAGVKDEDSDKRYVVVSGTPQKILEHLLSDLRLDEQQGATESKEAETLLDDFLLTYLVFMSTSELCQALLGHYSTKRCRGKEEGKEALFRKRKVLHLVSQWSTLYKDFLREEENIKPFMQTLYRYVLEDVYEFPTLEKDLKEFQKLLRRRHTVDDYSPHQKNKALYQQLSLKENCVPLRASPVESKDVMCRVYVSCDSYLSMRVKPAVVAQELLHIVSQRMERSEDDMMLVAQTYSGEKRVLQPHDSIYSESLTAPSRLIACRRDLSEILPPLTECPELGQKPVRLLGINTWDVAVALTNFDWNLFNSIHEQELIFYTFSGQASSGHTVALEFLLQRCNEVQQWVMSEVLLCPSLSKRVQLLKKFIKIAAHCKAQRNLNSSFAIIMGLNTAAVSRLNQTWEKVPGKFKKLFSELELLTDPSMNHKAYRDAFKKMKPPKIPFMPLLLKGNELSACDGPEVRSSVHYLHIIDNQQTLFQLSHRLEPRV